MGEGLAQEWERELAQALDPAWVQVAHSDSGLVQVLAQESLLVLDLAWALELD